jgi:hypothetical protein
MGTSFDNCQVRNESAETVVGVLTNLNLSAFVSDVENGWVSVFPHESAGEIAQKVSENLQTTAVYLWQFDSDVDGYVLYHKGEIIDEFVSNLEYGLDPHEDNIDEIVTPEIRARYAGKPTALLPYCLPNTTEETIKAALHDVFYPGALCSILGIPEERCTLAFRFIERGEATFPYSEIA